MKRFRRWAKNRKVAGSIPDGVFGISARTTTLTSTQSQTEISTRNIYWGEVKAAGA